jgi:hypothetical protein
MRLKEFAIGNRKTAIAREEAFLVCRIDFNQPFSTTGVQVWQTLI